MAVLISKPLVLSIIPRSFGLGAEAGSLVGDHWTPGRDSEGVVNRISWNLVPKQRWVTVDGTRMDSLDPRIKAVLPNWRELASWDLYSNSWSSMAPDLARSRVFYSGGGHGNGSNNGLYSFNFYRMGWDVEMLPSDTALWSDEFKTQGGGPYWDRCAESAAATNAEVAAGKLNPINSWGQDEIFWDHLIGVGKMAPKHTYHSYVYVPSTNEVVFTNGRLWRFSLGTGAYTYKRHFNDNPGLLSSGTFRAPLLDINYALTIHDEATGEILTSAVGSSGVKNRFSYNLTANTWSMNPAAFDPPWKNIGGFGATRVGRLVSVIKPPTGPSGAGGYWVYDIDKRSVTISGTAFQYAGGLVGPESFYGDTYDAPSLEYIAAVNRYWLWTRLASSPNVETMACIEVNPTTNPWTMTRKVDFVGNVPAPNLYLCRRMFYLPDQLAVWMYDRASLGWYVYRF
jgi:hypothetical protein